MKLTAPPEGQIGAEVTDTDPRTLTAEEAATLRAAVYRHKLVVFRDQTLDKDEYLAFARKLGRPQVYFQKNYHHPQYPEIFVSSNVPDENGCFSKSPIGPFQNTVFDDSIRFANSATERGPMSSAM